MSKIFKIVICTCVIATAVISLPLFEKKEKVDETAALTLNYSEQLLQTIQPNFSLRIFELIDTATAPEAPTSERWLYPGGQSIGILLRTDGILVVGQSAVIDAAGNSCYPAENAGIETGDVIVSINQIQVTHDDQLAFLVNQFGAQGQKITLKIKRKNREMDKVVIPIFCQESKSYRIGLYIRDNAGGVGTLSFIDAETGKYGALGHMISNQETQEKIDIIKGKLVLADIEGIKKGLEGYPGEKIGRFVDNHALGTIEENSSAGIYGEFTDEEFLASNPYHQLMPIANVNEIQLGEAEILTVLEGNKVECFTVMIEKVKPYDRSGKGLVIKVTDPILLEKTGGIVQGMSGSPILQDGKLVGAVTHVLVNDPTRGYGIFIENMLDAAG